MQGPFNTSFGIQIRDFRKTVQRYAYISLRFICSIMFNLSNIYMAKRELPPLFRCNLFTTKRTSFILPFCITEFFWTFVLLIDHIVKRNVRIWGDSFRFFFSKFFLNFFKFPRELIFFMRSLVPARRNNLSEWIFQNNNIFISNKRKIIDEYVFGIWSSTTINIIRCWIVYYHNVFSFVFFIILFQRDIGHRQLTRVNFHRCLVDGLTFLRNRYKCCCISCMTYMYHNFHLNQHQGNWLFWDWFGLWYLRHISW